ncbi:hypothetical protein ACLB2K_026005 [Fragaria x ananassa]
MKTLVDLRNDLQQAKEDRKSPTIEEWLREAQELERKVLLTKEGVAENNKKKQLCTKRWKDSRRVLSMLLREKTDCALGLKKTLVVKQKTALPAIRAYLTRSSLRLFNLDYLPRLLARYPNLTTFETNKVIRISDDYLELVSQSCPNLEAIKLDAVPPSPSAFNRDRGDQLWEMLLSGRKDQLREPQQVGDKETIEVLSLDGCSRITDDGVLLLCKMRVLEELRLTKCGKLIDVGGQAISTIPTLKKLNLTSRFFFSSRSLLTEKTFVALAKNCINLEVLCLDSVTAVNTGAIVAFMGHECLRSLKLNGSLHDDFRVSSLDCLALLCPSLESIVVHECWRERLLRELHETTVIRFLQFVTCRGETLPCCAFASVLVPRTHEFQKYIDELDKEMKTLVDLRNDCSKRRKMEKHLR